MVDGVVQPPPCSRPEVSLDATGVLLYDIGTRFMGPFRSWFPDIEAEFSFSALRLIASGYVPLLLAYLLCGRLQRVIVWS